MTVIFLLRSICPLCGCRLRGLETRRVRVNARTLRTTAQPGIGYREHRCPECRWPAPDQWDVAGLLPDDAGRVGEAQARLRARRRAA